MSTAAQQVQMFYDAVSRAGEVNVTFLDLVKDGMTREELAKNIARRPSLWQRFEHWLPLLPSIPPAIHDRPLAAEGLLSYRCKGRYGWIMIGAKDHDDAMREARRSSNDVTEAALEIWDGERYVPVARASREPFPAVLERAIACSGK
jgi:hypothetical protein